MRPHPIAFCVPFRTGTCMMRTRLLVALLVLLAAVSASIAAVLVARSDVTPASTASTSGAALIGGPFSLVSHEGERVTEKDFRGRYTIVYFGYTYCPDVCPLGLQIIAQAMDLLPPEVADRVVPVFITVDPGRDTVEVMKGYVELFHPKLVGLTGTQEEIDEVLKAYRVYARKADGTGSDDYLVDHSAFTYVMGPEGDYVTHFSHGVTPEEMATKLEEVVSSS
jgi:cytochrome oxidase Cu insertion factor (SCO1/SenC/PrrC family)